MKKQNLYDEATDIIKERISDAYKVLHDEYKSANPYRKIPMSPKEQLLEYADFTPDKEQMMRQSLGNEVVDDYHMRMQALMRRQR